MARVLTFEGIGHETLYASCERACDQGEVRRLVLRGLRKRNNDQSSGCRSSCLEAECGTFLPALDISAL